MRLNELGEIVVNTWMETAVVRYNVLLDAFVVMPNHVHGIIIINDGGVGAMRRIAPTAEQGYSRPTGAASGSLGAILGQIKSISTKRIKKLTQSTDNPVWQRNYYEHIIRNETELAAIRLYIKSNPFRWTEDDLFS